MTNTFWLNNPTILLNNKHITEIWPSNDLDYAGKLNAVTRLVLLLTTIGFFTSGFFKILISAAITLVIIVMMYKSKKKGHVKEKIRREIVKEGFTNPIQLQEKLSITKPTSKNPFMNVLLPEIKYNPERPAAAPAFNPQVEKEINTSAGNVGPDPRLFLDLGDTLSFEQSMQRFYTTANSRVENDQNAFAQFCYGDMPSCKDAKEGGEVYCG